MVTLLASIIKISPLYTSGSMVLTNGRVGTFFLDCKREESKIKRTKQNYEMKLFSDMKVPTLVHILQINVWQTYPTNYFLEGRTMSFSLFARFCAMGVTAFSISSSSEFS